MQTNQSIFFKKYHTIFIILYIFAFSMLLTGMYGFCWAQEIAVSLQTNKSQLPVTDNSQTTNYEIQSHEAPQQFQTNIAKNILRLHVIANSDTDADQTLKLAVRDEIIGSLQDALKNADSTAQASEIVMARKAQIEETAYSVLRRNNYNYSINVTLEERYFPVKQYGDLIFPAGTYQALCIEIGKAEGRNWWCVLFPSLCFVDETTATVPDNSKEALQESLSPEEYNSLLTPTATTSPILSEAFPKENTSADTTRPELHFGIAEWLQAHFSD